MDNQIDRRYEFSIFSFKYIYIYIYIYIYVRYHLPFQHNELFHLSYMAVAGDQSGNKPTSQTRRAVPIVEVYHYFYHKSYVLITNSLSLVNTLSCKYNYFPHISWFVLLLSLLVFTNQNTTIYFESIENIYLTSVLFFILSNIYIYIYIYIYI